MIWIFAISIGTLGWFLMAQEPTWCFCLGFVLFWVSAHCLLAAAGVVRTEILEDPTQTGLKISLELEELD